MERQAVLAQARQVASTGMVTTMQDVTPQGWELDSRCDGKGEVFERVRAVKLASRSGRGGETLIGTFFGAIEDVGQNVGNSTL